MKKILLSFIMLAASESLFAQATAAQRAMFFTEKIDKEAESPMQNKALGTAYPISDFSTPGDWVLDNAGETAPMGWTIDSVNDSWPFPSSIASTSGGNFLELYNGDPTTGSPAPSNSTFTATTANPIDIPTLTGGTSDVTIQFEQYGARFQDIQEVLVSTDGTTFVSVGNNDDIEVYNSTGGAPYDNPMLRTYDISTAIAGNPSTVWIRFSWSPGLQNITYGWFVDDVNIVTKSDNDLIATSSAWGSLGLHYYQIPQTQVAPIDFSSTVLNNGINTQTNVQLTTDVTGAAAFNETSALGVSLAAGATDSLDLSTQFTPSAIGTYNFTWSVSSDQVDDVPLNNVLTGESFEVTNYIYARDRGVYEGQGGGEDGGDYAFEAGNYFQIFADQQAFAIDVVIGAGTPNGTIIYGKIYEFDSIVNDFVFIDETFEYIVTSNDVLSNANITLPLTTVPTLNAGSKYLVVVGCYSEFYYGESGFSEPQTSFLMYGGVGGFGGQYYTNNTPMVRLNFEQCSSSSSIAETVCDTYSAPSGAVYSSTGIYTDTILNAVFCDSVITIDLTVNYSSSLTLNETACGSYTLNNQTYTSSGTYAQILTNAAGCDSTITLDLTINNNQFPLAFQANPTAGTTPLNVIFDNQTPNLSNYNFTWSFGDGTVVQDNGSFVSHTYQSDGTWDVMLIAEDITTGCTDTLFNNGYIFSTGGTPCGHVATISQSGPITACLSDSIFLSCNTDPNFTYQWQLNGFPISGATDQTYYPAQSGSYMVVITDNNCPVFSSTIQVTINTFTAPSISGAGSISSCSGGSMTLSVPDDYISYLWSSGGTDTSEVVTSSGDYTVTVTNVSGCQATSSVYSINASLIPTQEICIVTVDSASAHNLVVWEKPIVAGIDSFIVYREMGTNNYMPIGSVAYDSLSQFVDTANGINPNVTSYRYKVSILDTCGTESNLSYYHETMHLSTNQGIGGEVNLIWDEYEGFPIVYYYILRDSTSTGNWEVLDSVSSNNFIYTDLNPPVSGVNYVIEVLPPNTCTSTKAQDHNTTRSNRASIVGGGGQGIFQHQNSNVNVYPNPTSDQITIDIKGYNGVVNVEVYDLQGRLLETTTNTIVSLKKHAKGIYVLKVSYGEITEEVRVVRD